MSKLYKRLGILILFVCVMLSAMQSITVQAATVRKTGLSSVDGYDYIIDFSRLNYGNANVSFSKGSNTNWTFGRRPNNLGLSTDKCFYYKELDVGTHNISDDIIYITFKNAVQDASGDYYDLKMTVSNIVIYVRQKAHHPTILQDWQGHATFCAYDQSSGDFGKIGVNEDILFQVVNSRTGSTLSGSCVFGFQDLDRPGMYTDYSGDQSTYKEGIKILSGLTSDVYTQSNTCLNISSDGTTFLATQPTDTFELELTSSITFKGNASGTKVRWSGLDCGTGLTIDLANFFTTYTIRATDQGPGSATPAYSIAFKGQNKKVKVRADTYAHIVSVSVDDNPVTVTNNTSMDIKFDNVQRDHTVHAVFEYDKYYVDYNSNTSVFASDCPDKTITGNTSTKTCYFETTYYHWDDLINSWYYFTGWKTGALIVDGGSSFKNLASTANEAVTEIAQWSPKKYTIKYHTNKTGATGADKTVSNISVESSGSFWTPEAAYSKGYYIDHWNTKADDTGISYEMGDTYSAWWYKPTTATDDVINLYAIWKPYPYQVTYKAGEGTGSAVTETWYVDESHDLFNNTPQLAATKVTGNVGNTVLEPHFTKEGYYVDYWVPSFPTFVYESGSNQTSNQITGTGYLNERSVSKIVPVSNLLVPGNNTYSHLVTQTKGFNEKVVLTAHWAPIKYKITFCNDSTVPGEHGAPYTISSNVLTTEPLDFGEEYPIPTVNFTRRNAFGYSSFLGYCFINGCISKNPTFVVEDQSPESYMKGRETTVSAASFAHNASGRDMHANDAKTIEGTTWKDYFKYLNDGAIQSFKLYAVWDDYPGIDPVDTEQQKDASVEQYNLSTPGLGVNTASGLDLEYHILHLPANEGSVWDREDDITFLIKSKDHYYIKNFRNLGMRSSDNVSSYKLTFVIKDSFGHTYEVSRKLYAGKYYDIMLHENVMEFNQ